MMGSVSSSEAQAPGKREPRNRPLVTTAILIGALIGALITFLAGDAERRMVFDTWQSTAPREMTDDNVAVVMIDDTSVQAVGEWPWQRYQVAQLIERIALTEPAVIGVDIYFTQPDPLRPEAFVENYLEEELDAATRARVLGLPNWDFALADLLGIRPTVMARTGIEVDDLDLENPRFILADELFHPEVEGTPPSDALRFNSILASITELDGAASSQGLVNGSPDSDGVVRRVPVTMLAGSTPAPGFAAELARLKIGAEALRWERAELSIGDTQIPTDSAATFQFKMADYSDVSVYTALEVLRTDFDAQNLADKVVILGVGATGTGDIVATPMGSEVLGGLVQAQAVDAMIEGEGLSRPTAMQIVEIVAALALLALLLLAGFTFNNWFLVPAGALAIALPLTSLVLYDSANLLLDPVRPLLIGFFAGAGLLLARYAVAVTELIGQRIRAAEQAKENEAARGIQMSMVPSAGTLARLDHRTEIGAVLEPARSVGGDFFDALKIGDDKLLFLVGDVSGKGMPAALFMALSKMLSKSNLASAGEGLQAAVRALNHDLMEESDPTMGLTMLIGLIDCTTGEVEMVNAGHENPLVVRKNGSVATFAMVGGPPFCVVEWSYPVEPFRLEEGDALVVITDGATEAANEKDELFGNARVVKALEASGSASANDRAVGLAKQVRLFEGSNDPTDDLTIFALRYLGNSTAA